jgi:hypothetical protein
VERARKIGGAVLAALICSLGPSIAVANSALYDPVHERATRPALLIATIAAGVLALVGLTGLRAIARAIADEQEGKSTPGAGVAL